MIKYLKGDAVKALVDGEIQHLGHCVNCQGVMGAGIALQIKQTFPEVFKVYKKHTCADYLGKNIEVKVGPQGYSVHNLHGQLNYGRDKRHLNYAALGSALMQMSMVGVEQGETVGFPYLMGCGLAGGYWEIVKEMIQFHFKGHSVNIYKL